jgi:hypothetical protein
MLLMSQIICDISNKERIEIGVKYPMEKKWPLPLSVSFYCSFILSTD